MRGLVLEGGGARGCYQIGAYKAFVEMGIDFDYVVGTSIGAINAAMICQGDWEIAYKLWENLTYDDVISLKDNDVNSIMEQSLSLDNAKDKLGLAKDFIDNKGFSVEPLNELLSEYIDEKRVRESKMKFGLNTVDVEQRRVLNLFIDDIPQGHLRDYLRASSNLLVFKQEKLDGKRLIDGGYMENNPYKMIDDVCDEVVIVSLKPYLLTNKLKKNPKYTIIKTWDRDFPKILEFEKEKMRYGLKLGYDDTMKVYADLKKENL